MTRGKGIGPENRQKEEYWEYYLIKLKSPSDNSGPDCNVLSLFSIDFIVRVWLLGSLLLFIFLSLIPSLSWYPLCHGLISGLSQGPLESEQ